MSFTFYLGWNSELEEHGRSSQSAFQEGQPSGRARYRLSRLLCSRLIFRTEGTAPNVLRPFAIALLNRCFKLEGNERAKEGNGCRKPLRDGGEDTGAREKDYGRL